MIQQILHIILYTCNGLFFMLSGKFALSFNYEEKDCYKKYYFGKFVKIIIPTLFYMAIKEIYLMHFVFETEITMKSFIRAFILSVIEGYATTEYWFIYFLLANLLVAPFVARIFRNMTNKEFYLFFVICLLCNALTVYSQWLGHTFAVPFYLSGMNIYFFLGYFMDRISSTKKQKSIFMGAGIIGFALTFLSAEIGNTINIYDTVPTMTLVVCMIYIIIRDKIKVKKLKNVILTVGKYSYSIYLLHVIFMDITTWVFPYNNNMPIYIYIIIKTIMIAFSSFVVAFVLDNTIVKLLQTGIIQIKDKIKEKLLTKNQKLLTGE